MTQLTCLFLPLCRFCDGDENDTVGKVGSGNLACLEEMVSGIESSKSEDPWKEFPALR